MKPTCPPTNQHLMELLIMVDAARRASADRITAVIPFFGYARQDRKDQPRVPITAKLVANLLHAAGVNRVLPSTCSIAHAEIMAFIAAQARVGRHRSNDPLDHRARDVRADAPFDRDDRREPALGERAELMRGMYP